MNVQTTQRLGWTLALIVVLVAPLCAQTGAQLSEAEADRIREAQDPSERIGVYLDFLQDRLDRFEAFRHHPNDPKYDNAGYLEDLIADYIAINEEMKNWIDYQFEQNGDMRSGLQKLLEREARQLVTLRGIQASPDVYSKKYGDSLRDAVDQVADAIDGATKALAEQNKKFGELKKEEQEEKQLSKERRKQEAKRTKEEKKQRKVKHKGQVPGDTDEN